MGVKPNWTSEEVAYLEDSWGHASIPAIAKKLDRSVNAVKMKAQKLSLGCHLHSGEKITLPANVAAVQKVLEKQRVKADYAQAERVAWRIVKDWVEAQMAILESEMVQMDEIFLPYMTDNAGHTLYQAYLDNQLRIGE